VTDIKFHRNPSRGSRADTYKQMERQADMTKILGAFHMCTTALEHWKDNINSSLVKATTNGSVSQFNCHHSATEFYYYSAVKEHKNINCNCWRSLHWGYQP